MLSGASAAQAQTQSHSPPAAVGQVMPDARLAGQGRLTRWGFAGYDARLWVAPGFIASQFDRHAFTLELAYLRAFRSSDIVRTSMELMQRSGALDPAKASRWRSQLAAVFPDVTPGDRIAGVYKPGLPAQIFVNDKAAGTLADVELARAFFGIWLLPTTSEPGLRASLLGDTAR